MDKTAMRVVGTTFLKGLAAVLPIIVTIYLIIWLASLLESVIGGMVSWIFPFYFPGLGLLIAIGGIFVVGVLLNAWLVRAVFELGERLMHRIPLVKTVYGAVQDLMSFFSRDSDNAASQVVMVHIDIAGVPARIIGVVTREDFEGLPEGLGLPDHIAVYLPMSYQIGGYTVVLPRDKVTPVDMSIDQAMRYAVTAGMSVTPAGGPRIHSAGEHT